MTVIVSNDEILYLLKTLGYTIDIKVVDDSKKVTILSKISNPHVLPHCYSSESSDEYIRRDCVQYVLKWAGLEVVPMLQYV
ncbi:MAG: hypothetical protein WC136_01395 [Sphaerochaeta sp.]|jgi:hypothetical protein